MSQAIVDAHPLLWILGYLVIAGIVARFARSDDDGVHLVLGFLWPILLFAGVMFGLPLLIVGTIAGSIDPLEPLRDWRRTKQLERARRIARDEAELKALLEES